MIYIEFRERHKEDCVFMAENGVGSAVSARYIAKQRKIHVKSHWPFHVLKDIGYSIKKGAKKRVPEPTLPKHVENA